MLLARTSSCSIKYLQKRFSKSSYGIIPNVLAVISKFTTARSLLISIVVAVTSLITVNIYIYQNAVFVKIEIIGNFMSMILTPKKLNDLNAYLLLAFLNKVKSNNIIKKYFRNLHKFLTIFICEYQFSTLVVDHSRYARISKCRYKWT